MEPFLGQIMMFGGNFAPRGWALCDGQILPISQFQALYSLLGTTYGGDGRTSFGLPDLRGRSIRGVGSGPGLASVGWGEKGGANEITLSTGNLPSHNHGIAVPVSTETGEESSPANNYIAARTNGFKSTSNATLNGSTAVSTTNTGGNLPVNIDNPYLGIYACIAIQGLFPSRN